MAAIPRKLQKIFGGSLVAANNIAQIGSTITGTPVYSIDLDVIQSLSAYLNGFAAQVVNGTNSPVLEEVNAFFRMVTQQLAYLFETGIPEWNVSTTYFKKSIVNDGNGRLYRSLTDNNLANAVTNTTHWIPYDTTLPGTVIDFAGAGVLQGYLACDGSLVSRSTYADLFTAIGTTWGAGDGSTTFALPDLRGRATVGLGAVDGTGGTNWTLGLKGGAETVTLAENQLPVVQGPEGSNEDNGDPGPLVITATAQANGGHPCQFGGNQPHANVGPRAGLNKLIKY